MAERVGIGYRQCPVGINQMVQCQRPLGHEGLHSFHVAWGDESTRFRTEVQWTSR